MIDSLEEALTLVTRSVKITIRMTLDAKNILREAAREKHITISQFVLNAALCAASEV